MTPVDLDPRPSRRTVDVNLHQSGKPESVWRHPLLITLAGSLLAAGVLQLWQHVVGANERAVARERQRLERRFVLVQDITGAFSDTVAANEDVVFIYERKLSSNSDKAEVEERWARWRESSRTWRTKSEELFTRLTIEFSEARAKEFERLADERFLITNKVSNLTFQEPALEKTVGECIERIAAMKKEVRRFVQELAVTADAEAPAAVQHKAEPG